MGRVYGRSAGGIQLLWILILGLGLMFWLEPQLLRGIADLYREFFAWLQRGWEANTIWIAIPGPPIPLEPGELAEMLPWVGGR